MIPRLTLLTALLVALLLAWSLWHRVDDVVQVKTSAPATEEHRAAVPVGAVREFLAVVATTTTTKPVAVARSAPMSVTNRHTDIWRRLALCESGMNQRAYNPAGPYLGFFQFDRDSWRRAGGAGDPRDLSYEAQKAIAVRWQQLVGWGAWPVCSRRIGVR